jgi:hypothetical protein
MIEKTFFYRMIWIVSWITNDKIEKIKSKYDEQDQICCIFVKFVIILFRFQSIFVMLYILLEREKCLLSNWFVQLKKILHARRQFWQKAKDLMNKMVRKEMTRNEMTMYCNRTSSTMLLLLPGIINVLIQVLTV